MSMQSPENECPAPSHTRGTGGVEPKTFHSIQLAPHHPLLPFAASRPAPALLAAQPGERQLQRRLDQAPVIKTEPVGKYDGKATSYAINVLPHGARRGGRWGCCSETPLGEPQTEAEALELQSPRWHVPPWEHAKGHMPPLYAFSTVPAFNTWHEKCRLIFLPHQISELEAGSRRVVWLYGFDLVEQLPAAGSMALTQDGREVSRVQIREESGVPIPQPI